MTNLELLCDAIKVAGGQTKVGQRCGVSQQAVRKWITNGLPRTEWTGETEYTKTICLMCKEQGHSEFTPKKLMTCTQAA